MSDRRAFRQLTDPQDDASANCCEAVMRVFICHSSRDDIAVRALAEHLRAARAAVWLDQSILGGDAWWSEILSQIRSCTVFLVALSTSSLQSKPCQAEMAYAKALGLPMLPVLVADVYSYRIDPIFTLQSVDYRKPDVASGMALIAALHDLAADRAELPRQLPEPPPVPYAYLQRHGIAIDSSEALSPAAQETIVAELRGALRSEDDESVREDIRRLLRDLRRRPDTTQSSVAEIDDLVGDPDTAERPRERAATCASEHNGSSTSVPPHRRVPVVALVVAVMAVAVSAAFAGSAVFGRDPGAGASSPGAATSSPGAATSSPGAATSSPGAATSSPGAATSSPGAAAPASAAMVATVLADVDVYDQPDGVGNLYDGTYLHVGQQFALVEPCRDNWCQLVIPDAPGGRGWVYQDGFLRIAVS